MYNWIHWVCCFSDPGGLLWQLLWAPSSCYLVKHHSEFAWWLFIFHPQQQVRHKGLSWARCCVFGWLQSETGCSGCIVGLLVWVQTDEEMLERVLQNPGYPGNGLRHDRQQLACRTLVYMIGLPEFSLNGFCDLRLTIRKGHAKIFTDGFILMLYHYYFRT